MTGYIVTWVRGFCLGSFLVLAVASPVSAHHSFGMFDHTQVTSVTGVVKSFQWTNPHTWLQVVVTDNKGKSVEWSFEGGSPGILSRHGWKRTVVKSGDKVTVLFNPLKDGSPGGSFVEVKTPDGKTYFYHG